MFKIKCVQAILIMKKVFKMTDIGKILILLVSQMTVLFD